MYQIDTLSTGLLERLSQVVFNLHIGLADGWLNVYRREQAEWVD